MDSIKEIKDYIEKNFSEKRKIHTEGVRTTAIELAKRYGADPQKAEIAALFHDMYRGVSENSLNYYVKRPLPTSRTAQAWHFQSMPDNPLLSDTEIFVS